MGGSRGFHVAEEGHVQMILSPADLGGTATRESQAMNMEGYSHVDIILMQGVGAGTSTAILKKCTAASGGTETAMATNVYKMETTTADVLGARAAMAAAGLTVAATASIFYVISVDAEDLADDGSGPYSFLKLFLSALDSTTVTCALAIFSGARYAAPESPTTAS